MAPVLSFFPELSFERATYFGMVDEPSPTYDPELDLDPTYALDPYYTVDELLPASTGMNELADLLFTLERKETESINLHLHRNWIIVANTVGLSGCERKGSVQIIAIGRILSGASFYCGFHSNGTPDATH